MYHLNERLFQARVPAGSYLIGRPLAESTLLEKICNQRVGSRTQQWKDPGAGLGLRTAEGRHLAARGPAAYLMHRSRPDLVKPGRGAGQRDLAPELALGIFGLVVLVAATGLFFVGEVMLAGANVVTTEQVYRVIEWRSDFFRVGLPLTVILFIVVMLILPVFWPLTGG
jgi:hypothetical protein